MKATLRTILVLIFAHIAGTFCATAQPGIIGIVKAGKFTPPANQAGKSWYIALTHQREDRTLCVPASASIVLQHFGRPTSVREIKTLTRGKKYDPTKPFNDFTATMFRDLLTAVTTLGCKWRTQDYPNTKAGATTGLADIKKALEKGNPVLMDTNLYPGGHTFLVAGYDDAAQKLIILDSYLESPGIRMIGYRDLEGIWNSQSVGFNVRSVVFTAPPS